VIWLLYGERRLSRAIFSDQLDAAGSVRALASSDRSGSRRYLCSTHQRAFRQDASSFVLDRYSPEPRL